jgi:FkbM family methyltransferase
MIAFLKRVYDNFFLLRRAGQSLGFNYANLIPISAKISFKEVVDVIGKIDYPKQDVLVAMDSYRQIRNARALKKEPDTISWIENEIRPGDVFYDIGANIGAYSLIAGARTGGNCVVYSFEPSFSTFAALCKNIFLNNAQGSITPFQVALGKITGLTSLNYSDIGPGGAAHKFGEEQPDWVGAKTVNGKPFSQKVLLYSLDRFVKDFNLAMPNHIKIDVDGYEREVLVGAENVFSHPGLKSVLIEIEGSLEQQQEIIDFFIQKRFSLTQKTSHGNTFNCIFKRLSQSKV